MSNEMNNNLVKLTQGRIKSPKGLVIVTAIVALLCNLAVIVSLVLGGYAMQYYFMPVGLVVADVLFLIASIASNYRFRYAVSLPVLYILVTVALSALVVVTEGNSDYGSVFTAWAIYMFLGVHLVACLAVALACMRAAKVGRGKGVRGWAAICFALMLACVGLYGTFVYGYGWFGQGVAGKQRTLIYELNENGEYTVSGVLEGRGDTVVIPQEFNDKAVTAVNCDLFTDNLIENIYFEAEKLPELTNELALYERQDRKIFVRDIQTFRESFFRKAVERENENYLKIAELSTASNLPEGRVFVSFTYDYADLMGIGGNGVPGMYLNEGETLELGFDYVQHSNASDGADLHWSYENNDKRIFVGAFVGEQAVLGTEVHESMENIRMIFEPLYKVFVQQDNDGVYEVSDGFKYNGTDSRVLVKSDFNAWISTYQTRDGFDLKWEYEADGEREEFTDLEEVLSDGMKIYPVWTMQNPAITALQTGVASHGTSEYQDGATAVYGENISFDATSVPASDDFELVFQWKKVDGDETATDEDWVITNALPSHSGTYELTVTSKASDISSLTASVSKTATVTVNKRALNIVWSDPSNLVYTASEKTVSWVENGDDVINGDEITFEQNSATVKNADTYDYTAVLAGACAELYYITEETLRHSVPVTSAPLTVTWSNTSLVFNANEQLPTANATGLGTDGAISLTVSGKQRNAGVDYEASVTTENTNYAITNPKEKFTIAPYEVDVVWSALSLVYNGKQQQPTVEATGLENDGDLTNRKVPVTVNEKYKDVAQDYEVTAKLGNTNYAIKGATGSNLFTITKMQLTIRWSLATERELIYDGAPWTQVASAPTANGEKVVYEYAYSGTSVKGDSATGSVAPTDAGSYGVKVTLADEDINKNYEIVGGDSLDFTVEKLGVALTWSNPADMEYDGTVKEAKVTGFDCATGLHDEIRGALSYSGNENTDAGHYEMSVSVSTACNFTIESGTAHEYDITPRKIRLTWTDDASFVYDATAKTVKVESIDRPVEGEAITFFSYTGETQTNAGESYEAVATCTDDNYEIVNGASYSWSIAKKQLTLTWALTDERALVYDGLAWEYAVTANKIGTESVTYTYQYDGTRVGGEPYLSEDVPVNAGSYTVTASLASGNPVNDNYLISTNASHTFTVAQKEISLTWQTQRAWVYDAQTESIEVVSVSGLENGEQMSVLEMSYSGYNQNQGTHTMSVSLPKNCNYTITDGTDKQDFTISKLELYLVWQDDLSFVYDGQMKTVELQSYGVADSFTAEIEEQLIYAGNTGLNASGDYEASVSVPDSCNFTVASGAKTIWEITKVQLTLNLGLTDARSGVYDGKAWEVAVQSANTVGTEKVTYAYNYGATGAVAPVNAGSYTATASLASGNPVNNNYEIVDGDELSFTVAKRQLLVEWSNGSYTFNGKPQGEVPTFVNTVDEVTPITKYTTADEQMPVNKGSYTATVSFENDNYEFSDSANTQKTFAINAQSVAVVWGETAFIYNASAQIPTASATSSEGVTIPLTLTGEQTDAGENYEASASMTTADENYALTNTSVEFAIAKKTLTLTWKQAVTFDGTAKDYKPTVKGVCTGDSLNSAVRFTCDGADENPTNAKTYSVVVEILDSNYTFEGNEDTASESFVINAQSVAVVWGNTTFTYDGEAHAPTATAKSKQEVNIPLTVSGAQTNAGENYTATASMTATDSNYILTNTSKSFTITPAQRTVAWADTTVTYDGEAHAPVATIKDVDNETVVLSVDSSYTNASTYTVTASIDDTNYTLTGEKTSFTIEKQKVVVVWGNTTFTYDGKSHAPTATATDAQDRSVTLSVSGAKTNAGTNYTATASTSDTNYELTNETVQFTIKEAELSVTWSVSSYTYDGSVKKPTATATGVNGTLTLTVEATTGGINAGSHTAKAVAPANYKIVANETKGYSIAKQKVEVEWGNLTFTYDGKTHTPTATARDAQGRTVTITVTGGASAVGSHTAKATTSDSNYELTNATKSFTITSANA